MIILDGKNLAQKKRALLKNKIADQRQKGFRSPKLVVVMVGENAASTTYIRHKVQACAEVGILSEICKFPTDIASDVLYQTINKLNADAAVDGILLQLPIPKKFIEEDYLQAIIPDKDVDGFHYQHQGRMLQNYETIAPCTPLGVIELLQAYQIPLQGQNVTILGTSNIVGKPLGVMLINLGATVTFCNQYTKEIKKHTEQADILISATGQQFIITRDMVKSGAVVVDIGIMRDRQTQKLVGDVDYENVAPITSYITPVPGGVGPMTVASLLENTYKLYLKHLK
jgi:methylenetetrahydrofolate dehydrogenase (NADP+) / methenyltetrahydrofolate cyclohydrolase